MTEVVAKSEASSQWCSIGMFIRTTVGLSAALVVAVFAIYGNSGDAPKSPDVRHFSDSRPKDSGAASPLGLADTVKAGEQSSGRGELGAVANSLDVPSAAPRGNGRSSFDSSPDLFTFATLSASSSDPSFLGHGLIAAANCIAVKREAIQLSQLAISQALDTQDTAHRSGSARLLLSRCRGFIENDPAANAGLRARIAQAARATQDYVAGVTEGGPSDDQLRRIIDRQDFLGFEKTLTDLLERTMAANHVPADARSVMNYTVAYLVAGCDLGRDCTATGMTYAMMCAMESRCAGDLERTYLAGLDPRDAAAVAEIRSRIVRAFRAADMAFFGL